MIIKAIKFNQKGFDFYSSVLPAKVLVDENRVKVDQWSLSNPGGYQRPLQRRRVTDASWYVTKGEGWFPTSVLISIRTGVRYSDEANLGVASIGTLEIPDGETLWLIDGQHRVESLKHAIQKGEQAFMDYPVPVVIVANPDKLKEIRLFYLVNSRAKSVPADIAERLLQKTLDELGTLQFKTVEAASDKRAEKSLLKARATNVVDYLRERSEVWKGFIEVPGEPKPHPRAVKQHTLVSALLEGPFKDPSVVRLTDKDIGQLIDRYWRALRSVFPEAFDDPDNYSIRRTAGVYSLTMLFPDVFERCREARDYSVKKMEEILRGMNLDSEFWHTEPNRGDPKTFGTGMKSLRLLTDHMRELLPKLTLADF